MKGTREWSESVTMGDLALRACWAVDLQGGVSCTVTKFPVCRVQGMGYVRRGSIILSFRFVRGISLFRMIKGYISLQNDEESIPEHT